MKKFTTIKTLLVGLCAMGAMSAWGETISLTPSETTVIWGSGNGANGDATLNNNGDNVFYDAAATSWLCSQANISGGKLNNQNAAWGGSYVVLIKFDGSSQLEGMTIQKATLSFNSVCTVSGKNSNVITSSISTNWDATTATWNNTVNDLTISQISEGTGQNVKTSAKTLSEDVTAVLSDDDDNIIAFAIYTYTAREQKISDIKLVVEAINTATSAEFTLSYVDEEGNELKSEKATGTIGNNPELTNDQKASFIIDGEKYIYKSDDASEVTLAGDGSSVVKMIFRKAEKWAFTVNGVDESSNVLFTVNEGSVFEGENATVAFPEFFLKEDGELVRADKIDDSKKQFNYTFSVSQNNDVKTITYNSKNINNIIFYEEGENIEGLTSCNSANTAIRSSNSASAYATEDTKIVTLPAGTYKLHAVIYDASKSPDSHWIFKAGDTEIADFNCKTVNYQAFDSEEFTLTEETDIIMAQGGSNSMGLDLVYIMKVPAKYNYTITANYAGATKALVEAEAYENANVDYYYPKYVFDNEVLYVKNNNTSGAYFGGSVVIDENNKNIDIDYADGTIENIVYYSEAEDIEGMTKTTGANANIRCSNGAGAYNGGEDITLTTLPAGNYKISAMVWGNAGTILKVVCGETTMECETKGYLQQYDKVVTLTESTDVVIPAAGDGNKCLDYIYIQKLPEAVEINVDADAGYATYCSEYALYLDGIEAYTATISGTEVTFVEQMNNTVAPGTGLLIKAKGNVTIPIAAEGEAVSDNALIGVLKNTKVGAGSFVLMYEPYVGFFKAAGEFTVGANTAYLAATAEARIVLPGNEATAIKAIETEQNGEVYNLAGQRVVKAQKGLYIVNGKKVIK